MARTSKDSKHKIAENKKQNINKTRQSKAKHKSKYFSKTQGSGTGRVGKHITDEATTKSGKKLPKLGTLFAVTNRAAKNVNPHVFGKRLTRDFFDTPTEALAISLLGKILCRHTEQGETLCGRIVETEAYLGEIDPACHAYRGKRTTRNAPMYEPPGTAYVYFIYGMYHCFNISSKEDGACVLIRALEPVAGLTHMKILRDAKRKKTSKPLKDHELTNGPSKLCTALEITKEKLNNTDMVVSSQFWVADGAEGFTVVHTTRIGINSYGQEAAQKLYRYYILGNKHVSVRDKIAENKLAVRV